MAKNMLACKALVRDVGDKITVEPLLGLKVEKDLIVDMEPFFDNYKKVLPYFINESPLPADGRERRQSPEERARFDDTTKCILCAACTTSCPSYWGSEDISVLRLWWLRIASSSTAATKRLPSGCISSRRPMDWRCHTIFNCTMACRATSRSPKRSGNEDGEHCRRLD